MSHESVFIVTIMSCLLAACGNPVKPGNAQVNGMATSAYQISLPDGTDVWYVECPGWASNWTNCFARADHVCIDGFILLEQQSSDGGGSAMATPQFATAGKRTERVAVVKCK